jgi:hypothetical protein
LETAAAGTANDEAVEELGDATAMRLPSKKVPDDTSWTP